MTITQYVLAGIAAFVLLTIALIGWGLRVGPKLDEDIQPIGYVDQDGESAWIVMPLPKETRREGSE